IKKCTLMHISPLHTIFKHPLGMFVFIIGRNIIKKQFDIIDLNSLFEIPPSMLVQYLIESWQSPINHSVIFVSCFFDLFDNHTIVIHCESVEFVFEFMTQIKWLQNIRKILNLNQIDTEPSNRPRVQHLVLKLSCS